jgi:hypothetical protein
MVRNVGGIDRGLRILVGIGLLSLVFTLEGGLRWVGLIGLVPILTSLAGYCPLYTVLGLSTCPVRRTGR